jgi:hypothetical protein
VVRVLGRRLVPPALLLLGVATLCFGQAKVRVQFPDEGSREVWTASALPVGPPADAVRADGKFVDLPLGKAAPTDKVFVWDRKTGNVAFKPVSEAGELWAVKPGDFTLVGLVTVRVEHKGLPVAAAKVDLKDSRRSQTQLLDPDANGSAEFFGVAPGPCTVSTTYRSAGKPQTPLKQIFDIALKRDKPDPEYAQAIADDVATIGPSANDAAKTEQPKIKETEGKAKPESAGSLMVKVLITLIILAGLGYGVYRLILYLNQNSGAVQSQLQKLGVQVPEPMPDGTGAPPAPPAPVAPEKIVLDDAPLTAPTSAAVPTATPAAQNPRLVRDNGQLFQLSEGVAIVSREDGQAVSLVGEDSVSRRHAEIHRNGNHVTVKDLASTNGTYVNGVKLVGEATLNPGDSVQFGAVRLRYEG